MPDRCVFCGKPLPEPVENLPMSRALLRWYCSTSCARRQQVAIKRLRETSPRQLWESRRP